MIKLLFTMTYHLFNYFEKCHFVFILFISYYEAEGFFEKTIKKGIMKLHRPMSVEKHNRTEFIFLKSFCFKLFMMEDINWYVFLQMQTHNLLRSLTAMGITWYIVQ